MGEMRRMLRTELGPIHERLDQVENAHREQQQPAPNMRRRDGVQPRNDEEDFEGQFQ